MSNLASFVRLDLDPSMKTMARQSAARAQIEGGGSSAAEG